METSERTLFFEMIHYIKQNHIYLFLELRDYALKNKPDWAKLLEKRNIIRMIIAYTDSLRRKDNIRYNCLEKYFAKND